MLTESFIASTRTVERKAQATATKDIGIHLHDLQPIPSLKTSFKKSTTQPNCLAVSATHIFAAQADKSVIHVYNRDRGNQEAVVPFPENITCLTLAGPYHGAGTLVLGTQGGRLILWEVCRRFKSSFVGAMLTSPSSLQLAARSVQLNLIFNQSHVLLSTQPSTSFSRDLRTPTSSSGPCPHFCPFLNLRRMTQASRFRCRRSKH